MSYKISAENTTLYINHHLYYLFEEKSNKINLTITNDGDEYLEDSSIEVLLNKNEKYFIAPSVYRKPDNRNWINKINYTPIVPLGGGLHYPKATESEKEYTIFEHIGDVKHKIPVDVFQVPIRFLAGQNCINEEIILKIKVFGKNLPKPIEDELKIIVNE